jgi:hypothetical protein
LAHRIRALSDKGELPTGLAQATDLLRLIGNVAAHGSERSIGPIYIGAIDDFFIAILEYLYVAPEKIADFQKRLAVLSGPTISDVAEMLRLLRIDPANRAVVYIDTPDDSYGTRCVAEVDAHLRPSRVLAWLDEGTAAGLLDAAYNADCEGNTVEWANLPLRYGPYCEATEYLLLSNRTRQVFETDACVAWNPSKGPVIALSGEESGIVLTLTKNGMI